MTDWCTIPTSSRVTHIPRDCLRLLRSGWRTSDGRTDDHKKSYAMRLRSPLARLDTRSPASAFLIFSYIIFYSRTSFQLSLFPWESGTFQTLPNLRERQDETVSRLPVIYPIELNEYISLLFTMRYKQMSIFDAWYLGIFLLFVTEEH